MRQRVQRLWSSTFVFSSSTGCLMDSERLAASSGRVDGDAAFRKPSNDAANRKYRRRSPGCGSSSDGSPKGGRSPSPIHSKEDPDPQRTKDEGRDLKRDYDRRYHGRGDSYRPSDRRSSRSSHQYHKRDDYERHEKHPDDGIYSKTSYNSGRDSRAGHPSDYTRKEGGHYRSRDHSRGDEKYNRERYDSSRGRSGDKERDSLPHENKYQNRNSKVDKAELESHHNLNGRDEKSVERDRDKREADGRDEKRDYQKRYGDYRDDDSPVHAKPRGRRNDSTSRRDSGGLREASKIDSKELEGQKYCKREEKKSSDKWSSRLNDPYSRETGLRLEDKVATNSEDEESSVKKQKMFQMGPDNGKVSKCSTGADELHSSSSKKEPAGTLLQSPAQGFVTASDIDAAKVAAMRAAELVNRNLIGTGYMSADQKKKLLWGNKNTTVQESTGHRWDAAQFADREQQEKFNKLMGVKGEPKVESSGGVLHAEKQKELEQDLEKQYIAGLRRRDGRTVGLGL